MSQLRLITEQIEDVQTLYEASGIEGKKDLFIEGVFLQADLKNRNGRVYPKHILAREVNRYIKESISRKNAFGELNHPQGPTINLDRVSHLIVDLREDGSNFIGKAKILDTPMGVIARNIIEGGGQLAVSSRGMGSVRSVGGVMQVQEDFMLSTAADIVSNPSAPHAYVQGILEGVEYFYENGLLKERVIENMIDEAVRKREFNEQTVAKALRMLSESIARKTAAKYSNS